MRRSGFVHIGTVISDMLEGGWLMSKPEDNLAFQLTAAGIAHEREFLFARPRRFRADYRLTGTNWLVEINGAIWTGGRHSRGSGVIRDMEKMNLAALLGYRVLLFTPQQVDEGIALQTIEQALGEA